MTMAQQSYDMPVTRSPNTAYTPKRGLINDRSVKRVPPKKKPRPKRKGAY